MICTCRVSARKRATIQADIHKPEEIQARYVVAVAEAGPVDALARALRENEQQRARLHCELAALDSLDHLSTFDVKHIERDLRKRLDEWRALLQGLYEFTGRAKVDKLLSGIVFTRSLVAVRGSVEGCTLRFSGTAA